MENNNALVKAMMDVEYYPPSELVKMNIDITETQKFPIEKAAGLGVAFQPIAQLVSYAMGGAGQSGLYFVNTAGKTMFKSGGQFIGNLQATNGGVGGGLARMKQVPLDPTMLCMALVSPETTADYLLPIKTERTIGGKLMKGYAPQDTVRIKVQGGGENYVHGGISMQEMVVPVIIYKGMRTGYKKYVEVQNPGLSLISESRKVSNLMFSLDFLQKQPIGDKVQPCNYTLYFTDEVGVPVSDFQTVIADRTSNNASDRVFRVRFTLKQAQYNKNKLYRLVIANDTDAPEEVEFRIDIAFADDFGFDL